MITMLQLKEVRRLIEEEGHSCASAARELQVSETEAYYYLKKAGVKMPHMWGPDKLTQYGAYDRKTSELVAMGTAAEVAAQLGIKETTFRGYVTKGCGKYQIVKLDERGMDDEED